MFKVTPIIKTNRAKHHLCSSLTSGLFPAALRAKMTAYTEISSTISFSGERTNDVTRYTKRLRQVEGVVWMVSCLRAQRRQLALRS